MKIVRIIARLNVGGPARHVVWLTAGLGPPEFESVLVAGSVPPGEEDMRYFATDHGVTPFFIPQMSREISLKDGLTVWKLYRLLRNEKPDIVHTHTAKAGTVGRIAGFLYRWLTPNALTGRPRQCRFIHTYHGHIFHGYYGSFKTRLFLSIERMLAWLVTDRIVVVSEQQRREIHERFGVGRHDQFTVIPLGLDQTLYAGWQARGSSFREEIGVGSEELLIGIVGRLTEIKNHDLFLRAVALFKKSPAAQKRRVRFLVVGDGALRSRLEQQSQAEGLTADVVFAGNRTDPENVYPALDAVALTSRNEGTPLTLIEAMANARPVIATAVGGVVDLLGDAMSHDPRLPYVVCTRGISVPPDNAAAFAAGLARIVEDIKLRKEIGASGLQYVTQKHSRERLLSDIRALYNELMDHSVDKLQFMNGGPQLDRKEMMN
ncbi:MAG TPA: glycosyltransferase [Pyrinomonadaceae bacterium]|jgi:glycosyltransferase involved in cell wall biosynthesis